MTKLITLALIGAAALCIWVGLQMQGRDPLWWLFVFPAPALCLGALAAYRQFQGRKEKKHK